MTPAEIFLSKLQNVKPLPQGRWKGRWVACCPAHDDRTPSLYVAETADSRVLVHCHSHHCDPLNIVEAIGLQLKDLYPDNGQYASFYPRPRKREFRPNPDELFLAACKGWRRQGMRLTQEQKQREQEAFKRVRYGR